MATSKCTDVHLIPSFDPKCCHGGVDIQSSIGQVRAYSNKQKKNEITIHTLLVLSGNMHQLRGIGYFFRKKI